MLRLPHRTSVLAAAGACWLAAGCSLPGPSSAEPVGEPVPVIRVEVVSVERWIVDDLQVAQAPWDTLAAVPEVRSFDRWISPAGDTVEVPARFDAIREFRVIGPPPAAGG